MAHIATSNLRDATATARASTMITGEAISMASPYSSQTRTRLRSRDAYGIGTQQLSSMRMGATCDGSCWDARRLHGVDKRADAIHLCWTDEQSAQWHERCHYPPIVDRTDRDDHTVQVPNIFAPHPVSRSFSGHHIRVIIRS